MDKMWKNNCTIDKSTGSPTHYTERSCSGNPYHLNSLFTGTAGRLNVHKRELFLQTSKFALINLYSATS